MNYLLSFIPGFRSNRKWKKIIAIIYYAFSALMMIADIFIGLTAIILPFFIFDCIDLINHKKKAIPLRFAAARFVTAFLVLSLALNMVSLTSGKSDTVPDNGAIGQIGEKVGADENDVRLTLDPKPINLDNENDQTDGTQVKDSDNQNKETDDNKSDTGSKPDEQGAADNNNDTGNQDTGSKNTNASGKVVVHFIDVGQGDSILVQAPSFNMLIDGGNRGDITVNYLKRLGINELDLVIGTHPHADHIGGLVNVLEKIKVKEVIDPAVVQTTKTFEDYLTLIDEKNIKFTEAKPGIKRDLGNGARLEILGPASTSYSNLNNVSVISRLVFGNVSFLFVGDAETDVLNKLAKSNIESDVLKVSHHGSHNGMSQTFIKAVNPEAAVISVGKDNNYGHPDDEALDILAANDVDIYRTDLHGTVVIQSNGQTIDVNVKQPYKHTSTKVPEATEKPAGQNKDKSEPTPAPTKKPESTVKPTAQPTPKPTPKPTVKPAAQPTPKPTAKPTQNPVESKDKGKFVGSIGSDKYHNPGCRHAQKILPENQIWFDSADEAQKAGYLACGVCNPK